jgi:signal transduction histidine kinase
VAVGGDPLLAELEAAQPVPLLRAGRALGAIAFAAACLSLLHSSVRLALEGPAAFAFGDHRCGAALPTLIAAPFFLLAAGLARRATRRLVGAILAAGVFVALLLPAVAVGPGSPLWFALPPLIVVTGALLGVGSSLAFAGVVAGALLIASHGTLNAPAPALLAVCALSAIAAALLHDLLRAALEHARAQRRELDAISRTLCERERMLGHALRGETIGDLAGLVAHQLRNLFQVIAGYTDLTEGATDAERDRHLARVRDRLNEGRQLLEQLLDLARPAETAPAPCDLGAACEEFAESLRALLPAGIAVHLDVPDDEVPAVVDRSQLEHALLNLAINAHQAMDGHGRLTLRAARRDGFAVLQVADDGAGIARADLPRVFEPYYTTKPKGKGTGLGLAAVRRFVESAGGTVSVESEPGAGATFTLRLPLTSPAPLRKGG